LFQDVFQGNTAEHGTALIHHKSQMLMGLLKLSQQATDPQGFRHKLRRSRNGEQAVVFIGDDTDQVLDMNHPQNLIQGSVTYRVA